MKLAIPVENGLLCSHFGHAPQFAIVEIEENNVKASSLKTPPPHEPGVLPRWLKELGVSHVICGGIGARAVELLNQAGIEVTAGVSPQDPAKVVEAFLSGGLTGMSGPTCSGHEHGHGHNCAH